jgi:hypothetical protein
MSNAILELRTESCALSSTRHVRLARPLATLGKGGMVSDEDVKGAAPIAIVQRIELELLAFLTRRK